MNLTDRELLTRILGLVESSGSIDKFKLVKEITDHLEKPIHVGQELVRKLKNFTENMDNKMKIKEDELPIDEESGKTITLKEAWKILKDASAVIIDNGLAVTLPMVSEYGPYTGEDENEFLFLSWVDDKGYEHCLNFSEGMNRKVRVSGSSIFLVDNDEEAEIQITILTTKNLMKDVK
jgi:hypothetical protein